MRLCGAVLFTAAALNVAWLSTTLAAPGFCEEAAGVKKRIEESDELSPSREAEKRRAEPKMLEPKVLFEPPLLNSSFKAVN